MNPEKGLLINIANDIASEAHEGQKDKEGKDYIEHVKRVGAMGTTDHEKIVGLLHDVVEDTNMSLQELGQAGFPKVIIEAVDCLTKRDGEKYEEYLERVRKNELAVRVKLNDINDNSQPERLRSLNSETRERLREKYDFAKSFLEGR